MCLAWPDILSGILCLQIKEWRKNINIIIGWWQNDEEWEERGNNEKKKKKYYNVKKCMIIPYNLNGYKEWCIMHHILSGSF